MTENILDRIIIKATIAIDTPIKMTEKQKIALISRKVRFDTSDCKEILRILKKT